MGVMGEGENTHQATSRSRLPDSATPTGERLSKGAVDGIQGHVVHGTGPQCVAVAPASVGHEQRSLRHARPPVRADEDSPVRVVGWGGTDGRSHLVPARYALPYAVRGLLRRYTGRWGCPVSGTPHGTPHLRASGAIGSDVRPRFSHEGLPMSAAKRTSKPSATTPGRAPAAQELMAAAPATLHPSIALRYGARVLDPVTAMPLADGTQPAATAYVGDRLLVRGTPGRGLDDAIAPLAELAKGLGLRVHTVPTPPAKGGRDLHPEAQAVLARHWVTGVRLAADTDKPTPPVDAWWCAGTRPSRTP